MSKIDKFLKTISPLNVAYEIWLVKMALGKIRMLALKIALFGERRIKRQPGSPYLRKESRGSYD